MFRKIFAIPDIHGRLDLLNKALILIDASGYDPTQDALIFLGDYIDRGPDSKGVLDRIIELQAAHPDTVIVLRGNHEDFAVDTYVKNRAHAKETWYWNGGFQTEASYPNKHMSEEHVRWLGGLPYSYEAQGFFFSHAPVPRERSTKKPPKTPYNIWDLTWSYFGPECEKKNAMMHVHEGPLSANGTGEEFLIGVCGHIHRGPNVKEVRIFNKYRMLDTGAGCFDTGRLAVHECVSNTTFYADPDQV